MSNHNNIILLFNNINYIFLLFLKGNIIMLKKIKFFSCNFKNQLGSGVMNLLDPFTVSDFWPDPDSVKHCKKGGGVGSAVVLVRRGRRQH